MLLLLVILTALNFVGIVLLIVLVGFLISNMRTFADNMYTILSRGFNLRIVPQGSNRKQDAEKANKAEEEAFTPPIPKADEMPRPTDTKE